MLVGVPSNVNVLFRSLSRKATVKYFSRDTGVLFIFLVLEYPAQ
jgi:hypothetical protein